MRFFVSTRDLREVSVSGARQIWVSTEPGTPDHANEVVLVPEVTGEDATQIFLDALEKIRDPRKRDHREPDVYTELGCVMNIANVAIEKVEKLKKDTQLSRSSQTPSCTK